MNDCYITLAWVALHKVANLLCYVDGGWPLKNQNVREFDLWKELKTHCEYKPKKKKESSKEI